MPTLQEVFRSVMQRLARREIRAIVRPLRQDVRALRRKLSGLPRTVGDLGRHVATLVRDRDAQRATLQVKEEEARAARFSAGLIKKLRRRLKLTQAQLAQLAAVSVTAVRAWEGGRSRPQGARRSALVALRKLGRREVARVLAAKAGARGGPRARRKGRRRGRPARKARKTR